MVVVHRALRTTVLPSRFRDSYLVCLAWLVTMAACPVVKLNGQDWKIRLDDGSIATGQLVSSANDDTVAIQIIGFKSPFHLSATAIVSLSRLESKPETVTEQQQGMLHFELVDGKCFTGRLISVDAERLLVESSILGRLHVDRSSLQSISTNDNLGERLYDGPSTMDRWFSGKSTQLTDPIESNSLVALRGGITATTNLELPEQAHILLELSWKELPNFVIVLGSAKTTFPTRIEEAKASARLEVWNGKLVLVRETDIASEIVSLLDLSNPSVNQIRINIHLDQRNGEIVVMNEVGRLLGRLKQQAQNPQVGKCFQISNYGDPLTLDHLQVRKWSEILVRTVVEKDTVVLMNGQTLNGSLAGWDATAEEFAIKTPSGDQTNIKQTNLSQMTISSASDVPIRATQNRQPGDFVFVVLADQSRFQARFLASSTDRLNLEIAGLPGNYEIACSQIANVFGTRDKAQGGITPASSDESQRGKAGIIKMNETELSGRLAIDGEGKGSTALVWHPLRSRNSSSLKDDAKGSIVFKEEASAKAQVRKEETQTSKPNDTLLYLGGRKKANDTASCQMAFENGDVIDGKILQIDDQGVMFESNQTTCQFAAHEQIQSISLSSLSPKSALGSDLLKRLTTVPRTQRDHAPTHLLISVSGDYVRGRLLSLSQGEIEMDVRNRTSKIPVASISTIIWLHHRSWQVAETSRGEEAQPADRSKDPDKADADGKSEAEFFSIHFIRRSDRGITFRPRSLVAGKLSGVSDLFGECSVEVAEADRILFGSDISKQVKSFRQDPWTLSLARYPNAFLENEIKDGPADSVLMGMEQSKK